MRVLLVSAALALVAGTAMAGVAEDTQLLESARSQDPETALYALKQGANPMAREPDGTTALHYAAHYGSVALAEQLLRAKVDANARNAQV